MSIVFLPSADAATGNWTVKTYALKSDVPDGYRVLTGDLYEQINESPDYDDNDYIYRLMKKSDNDATRRYKAKITATTLNCIFDPNKLYRCVVTLRLRADTNAPAFVPYCHSDFVVTICSGGNKRLEQSRPLGMPFGGGLFVTEPFNFNNASVLGGDLDSANLYCQIDAKTDSDDYYMSCSWMKVEFIEAGTLVTA